MTAPGTAVAVQTPGPYVPMTFPQKLAYARELANSELLPPKFRDQASVLWAMEYGEALGLRGVVVIAGVHVIEGKPAPSAAMAAGLIRSRGHRLRVYLTPPTEEHKWGTAVAELVRKDDPEFPFRAEWSVEDAITAEICKLEKGQLLQYTKSKGWQVGNWKKFPKQMMKARALGEVCRDAATDVLFGLHYLAEEMEGAELDNNGNLVSSDPAPRWTPETNVRPVGEHTTTPTTPTTVTDITDATVVAEPITTETQGQMTRLFNRAGLSGADNRAARLRVAELILSLEREQPIVLVTAGDLTEAEGQVIVDTLTGYGDQIRQSVEALLADDEAARMEEEIAAAQGDEPEVPAVSTEEE